MKYPQYCSFPHNSQNPFLQFGGNAVSQLQLTSDVCIYSMIVVISYGLDKNRYDTTFEMGNKELQQRAYIWRGEEL